MQFEDGSPELDAAIEGLLKASPSLGFKSLEVFTLEQFDKIAHENALTFAEMLDVVEQAHFLLDDLYCHLPFKRARYAIDPIQQLRLLRRQLGEIGVREFHWRMLKIFNSLRDVHTNYFLPSPYAEMAAFLPFNVRYFHVEGGRLRFEVSATMLGFTHDFFRAGAELIAWNGISIEEAIDMTSDIAAGANESARFLRGLQRLTLRPLLASLPPLEKYVILEYRSPDDAEDAETRAILLPWNIVSNFAIVREKSGPFGSLAIASMQDRQAMRRIYFYGSGPGTNCFEPDGIGPASHARIAIYDIPEELKPQLPEKLDFQFTDGYDRPFAVPTSHLRLEEMRDARFAYIRIADFALADGEERRAAFDQFRAEFRRILEIANRRSPDGLIIDIRGNPGGDIVLAENLLQYLTPRDIEPARFSLLQTTFIQNLAARNAKGEMKIGRTREWAPWVEDLTQAPFTGNPVTRGFPLSDPKSINTGGQIYQGPVILITDGMTYSAADFFAAAFQDNEVGLVLGVQASTGGGGANRWSHADLMENLGAVEGVPLRKLPRGARMGVSLRRSYRAGRNNGQALEDIGVVADEVHLLTENDIHNYNRDLLAKACRILRSKSTFHLQVLHWGRDAANTAILRFRVATHGIARIEASLSNARMVLPQKAFHIAGDGEHECMLEMEALPPIVTGLNLRGFSAGSRGALILSAETKVSLLKTGEPPSP